MGKHTNEVKKFKKTFEISYEEFFLARFHPMLGIIRKFMQEFGENKVLSIVSEYVDELAIEQIKNSEKEIHIENFSQFKIVLMSMFNTKFMKNTSTFEVMEDTDEKFKLRCNRCIWAETFRKLNFDGENGYQTACRADFSIANALSPNITLSLKKTLMQGDEFCELCYKWEE